MIDYSIVTVSLQIGAAEVYVGGVQIADGFVVAFAVVPVAESVQRLLQLRRRRINHEIQSFFRGAV